MTPVGAFTIAADHPSFAGHFPDQPLVPGVLLLDHVISTILEHVRTVVPAGPTRAVVALPLIKFVRPVLPDQEVVVTCEPPHDDRIVFAGSVDGHLVVRGTLALAAAP